MSIVINEHMYYRTVSVYRTIGISRNTLFAWLKEGTISDVEYRNCRGWSLFTPAQVEAISTKTNHVFAISWSH